MATLHWKSKNERIPLRARSLFGRHPDCHVVVDHQKVSAEHAGLLWTSGGWELKDLASRNGTYVEGRRLAAGERVVLVRGTTFSLSRSAAIFELVDASPPEAMAIQKETGKAYIADRGILVLPNEYKAQVTLYSTSDGVWFIEKDSQVRPAVDHEAVVVGGATYVLEIPVRQDETLPSGQGVVPIESIALYFAVTPDEEQVEVTVHMTGEAKRLEAREYHYMLATLARARIADADAPVSLRGWLDRDDLCRRLNIDLGRLNVDIYRARKQLASVGVHGAARLVERRPGTHEIRLGVSELHVVTA